MSGTLDFGNKTFANKQDIKPWLDQFLAQNGGTSIVIERSDMNKIVFKCRLQKGRSKLKMKGRSRRAITCPFKIRANFSIRNSCWTLVVLNDLHDHELDAPSSSGSTTPDKLKSSSTSVDSRIGNKSVHGAHTLQNATPDKNYRADKLADLSYLVLNELESSERHPLLASDKRSGFTPLNSRGKKQRKMKHPDNVEMSFDDELVKTLVEQINELIKHHVLMNYMLSEESKSSIIRGLLTSMIQEHKDAFVNNDSLKSQSLNSWFSSTTAGLNNNPSANLIPLLPLLNDSDTEYHHTSTNGAANHAAIDSLTLPVISSSMNGTSASTSLVNTLLIPGLIQLLQIQNQNQQLPSFNSIQNNLPTSPSSMVSSSTASLFSSMASGSSSILPINNTSNTLNPSHLFKSSKNPQGNNSLLNSLLNLDFKQISVFPLGNGPTSVNTYLGNLATSLAPSVPASSLGQLASKNHDHLKLRHESDNE